MIPKTKITIILLVVISIASYFIGNINWAILISKSKNSDIRNVGSGNPGTLNMGRNFGLKIGLLTLFLDIMKGAIPTISGYYIMRIMGNFDNTEFAICDFSCYLFGLCVILGHIYPVIFKFKGGKGIASTIGVFLSCEFVHGWTWGMIGVLSILCALLFMYFTEFGAMSSFIAITPSAIGESARLFITYGNVIDSCMMYYILTNMFILVICFFTWFAHRKNIYRMLSGEEHPTSLKSMILKLKEKKKNS